MGTLYNSCIYVLPQVWFEKILLIKQANLRLNLNAKMMCDQVFLGKEMQQPR